MKSVSYNFWIYFYILDFWCVRSLLKSFSVKFQGSTTHKTYNCFGIKEQKKLRQIFHWKFLKVLAELFFELPLSGCSRSTLANKNMFKVDGNYELQLFQLMLHKWLCNYWNIFSKSVTAWIFSKVSGLTMNDSDRV